MSLRLRLILLLALVSGASVFLSGLLAGTAVITPFAHEAVGLYLDEVVDVAERVAAGEDRARIGHKLGLDIRVQEEPPRPMQKRCQETERRDHRLIFCRGRRAPVAVETQKGWVIVRRDLDFSDPRERIHRLLLLLFVGAAATSIYLATFVTRPLRTTKDAIARIAAGDLGHRLPISGPRELADLARMFNRMAERVSDMLKSERALMAGISHELRTPLARLRLEVEMLGERGVPEPRVKAMETDLEEIDLLIGELLEMSRLSLGERKLAAEPVDLALVVADALDRTDLGQHRATVTGSSTATIGDHDRLVRAVANLLENAVKYTPAESEIAIRLEGLAVEVLDNGPGVAPEALPRLFEPFYRAPGEAKARVKGLGLGLMIAHQIVTLHGGQIKAWNRPAPETGFGIRIELPSPVISGPQPGSRTS